MKVYDIEQGAQQWHDIKCGKVSASNFSKVYSTRGPTKGSARDTYFWRLVYERVSGLPSDTYVNDAMLRGIELEQEAREHYEMVTGNKVQQVGFIELDDYIGCSPDGLVKEDGLLEVKCPNGSTHCRYIKAGKLPAEYKAQVQGQLWVTSRKWCDFISYCPAHKYIPMFKIRVERDNNYIGKLSEAVRAFAREIEEEVNCQYGF